MSVRSWQAPANYRSMTPSVGGERLRRYSGRSIIRGIGRIVLLLFALGLPWWLTSIYERNVLVAMAINAALATGLAVIVRAGRLSIAQATFGGIGGYASGILVMTLGWNFWLGLFAAGIVAAFFGIVLGLTSLRLEGFYFVIATFVFTLLINVVLTSWSSVTGGMSGLFGLPLPPPIFSFDFRNPVAFYYLMIVLLLLVLATYWFCSAGSRFGRGISALGDNEILAGSIGVPATSYRLIAFAISSFIAGIAGSFNAVFIGGISPTDVTPFTSIFVLVMVLAGGSRSLLGPVVGAMILTAMPELLRASSQWSLVLYGGFLLIYVFAFRNGLIPFLEKGMIRLLCPRNQDPKPADIPIPTLEVGKPPDHVRAPAVNPVGESALEYRNIRCAFGENVILKDVSFQVQKGRLQGVIGPNGAGKTSLFNLTTGNVAFSDGELLFNGSLIQPTPAAMARQGVGRTFQHAQVFPDYTVQEAVSMAADLSHSLRDRDYLAWVVEVAGLGALRQATGSQLTHCQRRLLTIAMAIAGRPMVLLLDEPLAGLDDTETQHVISRIRHIHETLECAVLLIEHKLSAVMELCEWLTVFDQGLIIAQGPPEEVARDDEVIKAYLGED